MNAAALLIKSLVRDHAEAHPADKSKDTRCRELYDWLLADFGHKRLDQFTSEELSAVRGWLERESEPETVRALRLALAGLHEAREGLIGYIRAAEALRVAASPVMKEAAKRLNPVGLIVSDRMSGLFSHGITQGVHDIWDCMDSVEGAAAGLLSLARCLAHDGKEAQS